MKKLLIVSLLFLSMSGCSSSSDDTISSMSTITIDTQIWQKTNLNVETYSDGTPIPQITDPIKWKYAQLGAWCYYDNDPSNGITYGKLYNWYAVAGLNDYDPNTPLKKLAPTGFHIPSDIEWTTLTSFLGGENVAGDKIKTTGTPVWQSYNTLPTNSSGFTGLPAGIRDDYGSFGGIGGRTSWWGSNSGVPGQGSTWARDLFSDYSGLVRYGYSADCGFSVRCIKD